MKQLGQGKLLMGRDKLLMGRDGTDVDWGTGQMLTGERTNEMFQDKAIA